MNTPSQMSSDDKCMVKRLSTYLQTFLDLPTAFVPIIVIHAFPATTDICPMLVYKYFRFPELLKLDGISDPEGIYTLLLPL